MDTKEKDDDRDKDKVGGEMRSRSRCPILLRRSFDLGGHLAVELKKPYGNGSHELRKKKKGVLDASIDIGIQEQATAVKNFLFLNKLTSKRELGLFFWKREVLKQRLCELALQDSTVIYNTWELDNWIGSKEPGFIIKHFICDVDSEGLTSRQKKAGHRAAVRLWTLDDTRSHLQQFLLDDETKVKKNIKDDDEGEIHPAMYKEKGYVLRGSILTNGFRVKLLSFKLRGLQDVRYRRWREDRLPSRLTSTEIPNVLICKKDIERLWPGVDVKDIRTLILNAGQPCIFGAFAHLLEEIEKKMRGKEVAKDLSPSDMEGVVATGPLDPASVSTSSVSSASTMASLLTPLDTSGGSSICKECLIAIHLVSALHDQPSPVTKTGPSASAIDYIKEVEQVEERLKAFYDGPDGKYKRDHWDMQRARHGEFQLIAHRLLGIVGGGLGMLSGPSKPVINGNDHQHREDLGRFYAQIGALTRLEVLKLKAIGQPDLANPKSFLSPYEMCLPGLLALEDPTSEGLQTGPLSRLGGLTKLRELRGSFLRFATFINQKTHRVSSHRATPYLRVEGLCQLLEIKRPGLCVRFDEDSTKYEDMRDE
ncbi:hypothetical protein EC957_006861 [Mortierella hygrophila]|uniref:Uncharacterized protein n=1 Tax=Mortierella hygrophila TaxID=979708 RepID=A0A9P6EZE5_9FUNG|nr:hypothetical protein EC957_006861 [Mortierella hygrophila]